MRLVERGSWFLVLVIFAAAQHRVTAAQCPCDIYAAGGTPCVAAHSMVRALYQTYNGPLYQVRRASDKATQDIFPLAPGGFANSASQDSFLTGTTGTVSIIYDQSGNNNNLTVAPKGCYVETNDTEAGATGDKISVGGHTVYGLYQNIHHGYRKDTANNVPTGSKSQGLYEVVNGKHFNSGCCNDYGNAETDFCGSGGTGTMEAIYFGTIANYGTGTGSGPWIMGDFEAGIWPGGSGTYTKNYSTNPSLNNDNYVSGFLKSSASNYALKSGNAQSGPLTNIYSGNPPATWKLQGSIILGIGGDNSWSGDGTFYEGALTSGRPTDTVEDSVQANIVAAGYGLTTATRPEYYGLSQQIPFRIRYNPSIDNIVINCALTTAWHISVNIFDLQGRHIASVMDGVVSAGRHEMVWDAREVHAGIYIWKVTIAGETELMGKISIRQ